VAGGEAPARRTWLFNIEITFRFCWGGQHAFVTVAGIMASVQPASPSKDSLDILLDKIHQMRESC
jgi:hypothetical protein